MSARLHAFTNSSAPADVTDVAAFCRGCPAARALARTRPTAAFEDITYG